MLQRIILLLVLSFPSVLLAIPVASFDSSSSVGFSLSSTTGLDVEVGSTIFDELVDTTGTGVGSFANTGDVGPILAPTGFSWFSSASGEVSSPFGEANVNSAIDGDLVITNSTTSTIFFDLTFSADLSADIFTTDVTYDSAIAYAAVFIENLDTGDFLMDDFVELDSLFSGVGSFSETPATFVSTSTISLDAGKSASFYVELDVFGGADTIGRPVVNVSEPGAFGLFALGGVALLLQRRRNSQKSV